MLRGYLQAPEIFEAVLPMLPGLRFVPEAVPVLGRFYIPQIRISIKGTLKLLGIDLTVLVKDVGVHFCNHINFSMARISLCGFQIAVVEFQLISSAGMMVYK